MGKPKASRTRSRPDRASASVNHRPPIHFQAKTANQDYLWDALDFNDLLVVLGSAGTGKTYTTCMKAAQMLVKGKTKRIILARANVPTGKSLGAIPGDLKDKLEPWTMPMTDVLRGALGKGFYEYLVSKGQIETVALETIRGRSFEDAFILVDECQQLTLDEIKAISTRIGENSTLVFMGDPKQTDLKGGSGISTFLNLIDRYDPEGVDIIQFSVDDIVRSNTCANMVRMFLKAGL